MSTKFKIWVIVGLVVLIVVIVLAGVWARKRGVGGEDFFGLFPGEQDEGEGRSVANGGPEDEGREGGQVDIPAEKFSLIQLTPGPVAGATFLNDASSTVRYVERATGHIYDARLVDGQKVRVSNTTIPRASRVIFTKDYIIAQYLEGETIKSFAGQLKNGAFEGRFIEDGWDLAVSSPNHNLLYFAGQVLDLAKNTKRTALPQFNNNWLAQWVGTSIALTLKPTAALPGHLYSADPARGTYSKILGDINGLTALVGPNSENVIYSSANFSLSSLNIRTKNVTALPARTISDKCSFASAIIVFCGVPRSALRGQHPDVWYQGLVNFSDDIWRLDLGDGTGEIIASPNADLVSPLISEGGVFLLFTDKRDLSLWVLRLPVR